MSKGCEWNYDTIIRHFMPSVLPLKKGLQGIWTVEERVVEVGVGRWGRDGVGCAGKVSLSRVYNN